MKKEYIQPKSAAVYVITEPVLAMSGSESGSEGMGSNETPGGDDAFNAPLRRGEWGNLWI